MKHQADTIYPNAGGVRSDCVIRSRTIRALMVALIGMVCALANVRSKASSNAPDQLSNPPSVQLSFVPIIDPPNPNTIRVGSTAQFQVLLGNSNSDAITGIHFNTTYSTFFGGVINASDRGLVANTCGGTVTADPGTNTLALAGGVIGGFSNCSIFINVTGTASGFVSIETGSVDSDNAPPGFTFSDTIQIAPDPLLLAPRVTKSFTPNAVPIGVTSDMKFTLTNFNPNDPILGVQINDLVYPSGLANSPFGAPVVADTCGFFIDDVQIGGTSARLAGGTIPAGGECSITIKAGIFFGASATNVSGDVLSANAHPGLSSSATLTMLNDPDLVITKTHAGNFTQGQIGATYNLTVTNAGVLTDGSTVTVSDILPQELTATAISGSGWSCSSPPLTTCTRNNQLDFGAIYPPITVKVDVASDAPATVTNMASVAGGGELDTSNDTATDPTTITPIGGGSTAQNISFTSMAPNNAIVGGPTYQAAATATSSLPVTLTIDAASVTVCTIANGTVSFIGAGNCTIDANQSGDATFAPAPQKQQSFAVAPAGGGLSQSIQFTSPPPANAAVGGAAYAVTAAASSGLLVTLTIDATSAAVCTISNGSVSFIGVGTCTIDANQGGNATYAPAPQIQQWFAVAAGGVSLTAQTITFTSSAPNQAIVAGPGYSATATATSGLSVTMTIDPASATVCTINGGNVSFIGAGTCTIDANQGGDATFAPAPQKQQSFTVMSAGGTTAQSISFTSTMPANATVGGATYLATATSTSGLPVVLTIEASSATVCKINAGTVTFIGAGACVIDANQGGNATFAAAPEVQQSFAVASGGGVTPQAITFTSNAPANAHVAGTSYFAMAISDSGLPVVLTIGNASATVCTISNGWVSFIGAGTCTINANQGGNATYAPAPQKQQAFPVASAGGATLQTITFVSTAPANATVGGPSYLVIATSDSGLPVVLTIDASSSALCTINYGTVEFTATGTCKVDANQGGDATFAPAPQAQQSIAVGTGGGGGNHAPVAVDDAILVTSGGSSNVLVGDGATPSSVLDNDIDADNDPLHASKLSDPTHGDLTFNADGTFQYHNHQNDPATSDTFTYVACDTHAVCAVGIVTITIGNGLNDHVPFATDDAIQVPPGATIGALVGDPKASDSVLDNDIDFDGDILTASKLTDPNHGNLTFGADGTFTYHNDINDPAASDSFLYEACDDFGACGLGVVSITIGNAPTDHSPIVVDDAIQVPPGQVAQTLIGDPHNPGSVLDNDHDPDMGDTLKAVKIGPLVNNSGDVSLNADGTFSYHNVDLQATTDTFIYEACDSISACTAGIVTISINNNPPDVAPVAANDAILVAPHGSTGTIVGGATSVLTNDSDPGDTLIAHLISAPTNGHVTLNADGTFTYFNDDPAPGVDSWMYEACDSYGACTGATVSVTVSSAVPMVTCQLPNQVNSVGDTVSIDLSLLFAPPAGQSLTYSATNAPPSLSVVGSLLTGTLQASDAPPSPPYVYHAALIATTGATSASENVDFQVLPTGEILLRDGFDGGQTVEQPCQ